MQRPPEYPGAAQLRATLQELAAVEEWARRVRDGGTGDGGGGGPDGCAVHQEPVRLVGLVGLVGPVLRVETMTGSGMHRVIAISPAADGSEAHEAQETQQAQKTCEAQETQKTQGTHQAQLAAVRSVVRALLDLADHQEGPARTDVVITAHGPRIVACRLGDAAAGPAG